MALNSSGPISLGGSTSGQSVNLELSKSATAQISMNDAAVRTLTGKSSGAVIMPTDFYGKSAGTTNTVTVGNYTTYYGFEGTPGFANTWGSISPTTFALKGGTAIYELGFYTGPPDYIAFKLAGSQTNSGWTDMTIYGTSTLTLTRASAVFSSDAFGNAVWSWDSGVSNVFGTTVGATVNVVFT